MDGMARRRLSICAALLAAGLTVGCASRTEYWQNEQDVQEESVGPIKLRSRRTGAGIEFEIRQEVRKTVRNYERKYVEVERLRSTLDWDYFLYTILSVIGSALALALYLLGLGL